MSIKIRSIAEPTKQAIGQVTGMVAGTAAGLVATDIVSRMAFQTLPIKPKRFKKLTIVIGSAAIGYAVERAVTKTFETWADEVVNAWNAFAGSVDGTIDGIFGKKSEQKEPVIEVELENPEPIELNPVDLLAEAGLSEDTINRLVKLAKEDDKAEFFINKMIAEYYRKNVPAEALQNILVTYLTKGEA